MIQNKYDIIVIGAGSAGLSVGLFMNKAGFKVLMLATKDADIGGDCLNDGCVPSKALIHVSRLVNNAHVATEFGLKLSGKVDIKKVIDYVYSKQEVIRKHENAQWLKDQGVDIVLGTAAFSGKHEVTVNGVRYTGKKIVIATGSKPRRLNVPGVEKVKYYDNESIFHIKDLPDRLLVIGGGPIGIEIAQALHRLGSKVTVVDSGDRILAHDERTVTEVLFQQLQSEGIAFEFNAKVESFSSSEEAIVKLDDGSTKRINSDAVFVGIGRELMLEPLQLSKAGIEIHEEKIKINKYLQTTNKDVYACGDIAGDLQFSHAAEFHARIVLNNFFSPFKKKLDNKHMSWVTFTDPELATFGLSEKELKEKNISYIRLEQDFSSDDRAVVDNYEYAHLILYVSEGGWFRKQKILGGTMLAPHAGELIQELILANSNGLSINAIFNKIYPYPVASRVNQQLIMKLKKGALTDTIKMVLKNAYKIFS